MSLAALDERGVILAPGPAVLWDQAGWPRIVDDARHTFAIREVSAIAGASQYDASDRPGLISLIRQAAEGVLATVGAPPEGATIELRYTTQPRPGEPTRVRLFVTAKMVGGADFVPGAAEGAVEAGCAALPDGFEWQVVPAQEAAVPAGCGTEIVEVRKQEEVTPPQLSSVPADFYYAAHPIAGDGSGWARFGSTLARLDEPVTVSLLFAPASLQPLEQAVIAEVASNLALHAFPRQEQNVLGGMDHYPADEAAAAMLPIWRHYLGGLQRCVLARFTVRGSQTGAQLIARALAATITQGDGAADLGRYRLTTQSPRDDEEYARANHSLEWLDVVPWGGHPMWGDESAPSSLRRLPYLYGLDEAAAAAVLPVPDEQGAPGLPRAARSSTRRLTLVDEAEEGPVIELGSFVHENRAAGTAALPLAAINRHVLVVGSPGSGKTTTVLTLLARLWTEHRVPFMAIEPTKTEYRSLLEVPGVGSDLRIVTLGSDHVAPIRLNPLAPPPGVRCEVHMSAVMAAFRAALPLDPPLPQLLEEALERSYELAGWRASTTVEDGRQAPTLRDLLSAYEDGFAAHGYSGEVRDNLLAALRLRLKSLLRGSRGLLLDSVESVDWDDLMVRPVVVELDQIADRDDKAILSAFLVDRLRAAARARGSTHGRLAHVTVLEEAHRLLGRIGLSDGETPQAAAIRSLCDAIAELRALGEGFVISSQSPGALADAAIANTATRVLHRLESASDRESVLADADAGQAESATAARLARGEAIVRWPQRAEAELVRVTTADGVDSGRAIDDAVVEERMAVFTAEVRALLPYRLCTRAVCEHGCAASVREAGADIAADVGPEAAAAWSAHGGAFDSARPVARLLAARAADARAAYCGAVHLSVQRDAFMVPRKDIRPALAEIIRAEVDSP